MKYYCEWIPHDLIKINSSYESMNIQNQFLIATDFFVDTVFPFPKKVFMKYLLYSVGSAIEM